MRDSTQRDAVIASICRTLFVISWAENELDHHRQLGPGPLHDLAPRGVTRAARVAGRSLAGSIERDNQQSLDELCVGTPEDFGYHVAMQALGMIRALPDIRVRSVSRAWDITGIRV